jgi:SAM-dependent methyltransferase
MVAQGLTALPFLRRIRDIVSRTEAAWFDWTRHVKTSQSLDLHGLALQGPSADAYEYLPSRAATARMAIDALPISCFPKYSFLDIGSGKGKVLFIAAEYPFRRVQGVEFATELHQVAYDNINSFRTHKRKCIEIESTNINAVNYIFPNEPLVVYFFNPFGSDTMSEVLTHLSRSLVNAPPRHVCDRDVPETPSAGSDDSANEDCS